MSFYGDAQLVADSLLSEYGQQVTLTHNTAGVYDPTTGTVATTSSTELGHGVIFDYPARMSGLSQADGTLILQGDKQLLLSAVGITAPKVGDLALANGITYIIKNIKSLNPAGTVVMYECQLGGA
jgi:hypothetical protein